MLIGIGGCSRSGKTTLANDLVWYFRNQNKRAIVVSQDDFVFKIKDIPLINNCTDWDTPDSLNFELICQTINYFKQFFDIIIVEGHFVFSDFKLRQLFDCQIFIDISQQTFIQRRASETRWGQEPDWFVRHVWDSFLKHGQPTLTDTNLMIVSGEKPLEIDTVIAFLTE